MSRQLVESISHDPLANLSPVDPSRPAGPQVFACLKTAILTMTFAPGQPLSEPEIGAALGVSRTPVREAFARLRAINLVTTLPSRGSYVTKLDQAKIREAQYLREALELANVHYLIAHGVPAVAAAALRDNLAQQENAVATRADSQFHLLDDAFHLMLAEATGFARAAVVLGHEKAQLDRLRMLSLHDARRSAFLLGQHQQLFDAIMVGDLHAALAVAKPHLDSILSVLHGLAADHADFFEQVESA